MTQERRERLPLIVIGGATATGKTELALNLAAALNTSIISADSMQVYKYMDIGTAKPNKAELARIKHYLTDELEPDEEFSVAIYKTMAANYIKSVHAGGKVPILVGGTGFYINAVLNDAEFSNINTNVEADAEFSNTNTNTEADTEFVNTNTDIEANAGYREQLYDLAARKGAAYLHDMLKSADPESAALVHVNNIKRVSRALEYYKLTGIRFSEHNRMQKARKSPYDYVFFVTDLPREKIYAQINQRADRMLAAGLEDEVRRLLALGYHKNLTSMQGLGYKEMIEYIEGNTTLDDAVSKLKQNTRHYAKRQITWFKNKTDAVKLDMENIRTDDVLNKITNIIGAKRPQSGGGT